MVGLVLPVLLTECMLTILAIMWRFTFTCVWCIGWSAQSWILTGKVWAVTQVWKEFGKEKSKKNQVNYSYKFIIPLVCHTDLIQPFIQTRYIQYWVSRFFKRKFLLKMTWNVHCYFNFTSRPYIPSHSIKDP